MPRIRQLDHTVVTKIAAGEVIERPASVVKELLENAVDAGSKRIELDVAQGGIDMIRVVDDGCGIHADDLALAFASHATSKLGDAEDLFRIGTLGFRGEALASIGGIAQVGLQSRPREAPAGAEIDCHGGQVTAIRPWNGAVGTRIEVRHLFYNTPVRRKFLRAASTEMGHVSETFTRLALAYPELHLTLRHNGKSVYDLQGGSGLLSGERLCERIGVLFGRDIAGRLYEIEATQGPTTLRGFIADPACERGNARTQYLFINGRWIRDRTLGHAIQEAYRGLLMTGRYAVVFLFVEMPADQVDVNVHPTKAEVRFQNSQALHHLIYSTIRERLDGENLTAKLKAPRPIERSNGEEDSERASLPWTLTAPPPPAPALPFSQTTSEPPKPQAAEQEEEELEEDQQPQPRQASAEPEAPPPHAKILQLHDAYLVVETPEGMLVIDQHALHERILFEQLKQRIRSGALESQRLLVPEQVELTTEQAARTVEQREALAELGLEVEDFGGGTVLLSSYPAILGRRSPASILRAVVDHLTAQDRLPTREVLLNDLLSLMACHAAVRAGDRLTPEAMSALIAQRHLADDTHHCPHGRPTALLFTKQELDRQFRRT